MFRTRLISLLVIAALLNPLCCCYSEDLSELASQIGLSPKTQEKSHSCCGTPIEVDKKSQSSSTPDKEPQQCPHDRELNLIIAELQSLDNRLPAYEIAPLSINWDECCTIYATIESKFAAECRAHQSLGIPQSVQIWQGVWII